MAVMCTVFYEDMETIDFTFSLTKILGLFHTKNENQQNKDTVISMLEIKHRENQPQPIVYSVVLLDGVFVLNIVMLKAQLEQNTWRSVRQPMKFYF